LDDVENLQLARDLNVIDEFYTDIETAVKDSDCVIIATPVAATEHILRLLKPFWSEDTIYFDVGSTKGNVVVAAETVFGFVPDNFIPAHPIAGAENSGVGAALVDLFVNKRLILTPLENTDAVALQKTQQFWEKIGAVVSIMDVQQHDSVLAATSHLPHLLAFALVDGRKTRTKNGTKSKRFRRLDYVVAFVQSVKTLANIFFFFTFFTGFYCDLM
jgi:prephenate dehydrogenase